MERRHTLSVIHTSARPEKWRAVYDEWMAKADHPENVEYCLCVDQRWGFDAQMARDAQAHGIVVTWNTGRMCYVDGVNRAAAASSGRILVPNADDLFPPEHWDTLILDALYVRLLLPLEGEAIVICSSGAPPDRDLELMTAFAMTRARYERYGYIVDPDFEGMWSDNHFAWQARRDEKAGLVKIVERLDIQMDHRHPIFGKGEMDAAYESENKRAAYQQGQATFMKKAHGTQALYVCLPGETFHYEVVVNQFALLNHLNHGLRFFLSPVWGFTTNVHCTRIELADAVLSKGIKPDLVLWIDDDNYLTPPQFDMLAKDLDEHPELAGVVGYCWCDNDGKVDSETGKLKPWMISCGRQGPNWECLKFTQEDIQRAVYDGHMLIGSDDVAPDAFWSGFPVVLMRGSTLQSLGARSFAPIITDKADYGFVSEDAAFFYRAHQAGLKFAVDLRVQVPHLKFRAIAPQWIPIAEREAALKARGELAEAVSV
jgi:hypothetical protein